ncbi:MAG: cation transporter [Oscillospiraceae bacterium]|nr:cation transporter [Oscillospiraceae bacterium]
MIKYLIKTFVKDYEKTENKKVRESYCVFGGIAGAVCNLILFGIKLFIGIAMNSIAIMSDAFNNLSDMGSCFVAVIGAKLAGKKPDREHPFGHGRIEYISALIVSFIIVLVGFELLKSSFEKIIHPEEMIFSMPMMIILAASLLVKFWMYCTYNYIGKTINSSVMIASAKDSINDVISTGAVIIATAAGYFLPFKIDGIVGLAVAVFIMISGFNLAKDTIDLLLGKPPSEELIKSIGGEVMKHKEIVGMHDLIIHDYGPGRVFASVHAEIPDDADIINAHEIIDRIEQEVFEKMGVMLVIHMDPITVNNEFVDNLKKLVTDIVSEISPGSSIHDFRITDGEDRINVIFDIVIENVYDDEKREKIVEELKQRVRDEDDRLRLVVKIDEVYI